MFQARRTDAQGYESSTLTYVSQVWKATVSLADGSRSVKGPHILLNLAVSLHPRMCSCGSSDSCAACRAASCLSFEGEWIDKVSSRSANPTSAPIGIGTARSVTALLIH